MKVNNPNITLKEINRLKEREEYYERFKRITGISLSHINKIISNESK